MGVSEILSSLLSLLSSPENLIVALIIIFFSAFLIIKRKNLTIQTAIPYVLYFVLFKGKYGIEMMGKWAKRFPRFTKWFGYSGIGIAYIGMITIGYMLSKALFDQFTDPTAPAAVMPILPVQTSWGFYVPPLYFLVCLFIIAVIHEFAHGLVARRFNLPVKASGFGFLGIFVPILPLAFVEPDEEALKKAKPKHQLAVYSAGPTSNIFLAVILGFMLFFAGPPLYDALFEADGLYFTSIDQDGPAALAGIGEDELILSIDGVAMTNYTDLFAVMDQRYAGDIITIESEVTTYEMTLAPHPNNETLGYMSIFPSMHRTSPAVIEKFGATTISILYWFIGERTSLWDIGLIGWLIVLNLGIGLFNFTPLAIVDGGRILLVTLEKFLPKKKAMTIWKFISLFFGILLAANIAFLFIK